MKKLHKILTLVLVISMLMGLMALPAGATGISANAASGETSKDKVAQWHEGSQTIADVTLSVPGEVEGYVDVVFVLGGGMTANMQTIESAINVFKPAMESGETTVRMGLISLEKGKEIILDLNSDEAILNPDTYVDFITEKFNSINDLPVGSPNLHSQLLLAQEMLAAETKAKPESKYLFVLATGRTYWFDDANGEQATIVNKVNGTYYWGNYLWQSQRGRHTSLYMLPDRYNNDYEAFFADVEKWVAEDGDKYVYTPHFDVNDYNAYVTWEQANNKDLRALGIASSRFGNGIVNPKPTADNFITGVPAAIGSENHPLHALNYERAQYECVQVWKELVAANYNCYSICSENPNYQNGSEYIKLGAGYTGTSTTQLGHSFMNYLATLAGQEYAPTVWDYERDAEGNLLSTKTVLQENFFASIEADLRNTCGAGSYVEDYMGYNDSETDGFNFDFMVDGKITLTVGTTEYTTTKLETAKEGFDASYTFTAPGAAEATFALDYVKGNGTTEEKFIWTFGEDISNFAPAKLNYQVELVEAPAKWPNEVCEVETNQKAMLYPVDGEAEAFPVPKLTLLPMYTVTYEYVGVIPENAPEVPAAKDYIVGANVTTETAPELDGYEFFGWNNPHTNDATFEMPAHDITITGYWMPENDFVDPPIGIKTDKETGNGYQYDVTISVPGDGEEVKVHDEIILVIDGSYSGDDEWADMKKNIIEIGNKVLGGAGRTEMTVIAFGMGDNIVVEGIKTVAELEAMLPSLPGGLLYGRSSTNCEAGFTGALKYIENKKAQLSKVDVIFISDGGINTNDIPRAFGSNWQTYSTKFGALTTAQAAFEATLTYGKNLPAAFSVFGDRFANMTNEQILNAVFVEKTIAVTDAEFLAFGDKVWADVYAASDLTLTTEYPISVVERAFVKYDEDNGTFIQDIFYYSTYQSSYVTYPHTETANRTIKAAEALASHELVNELYLVRYANDSRAWWMEQVNGGNYFKADNVENLLTNLTPMLTELSQTNYTNVVITDYMSKWVILDPTTICIKDGEGKVIWQINDDLVSGTWLIDEENRPTSAAMPVVVEVVDSNKYIADDGVTEETNVNGIIYKLTWYVKDDCLLRTDNYSLHYVVDVDIDEPGFIPGQEFPANGHTFVEYETDGSNNIQVPNVTIPAYTVTYLNGEIQLQKTDAHKTGDAIPVCEEPSSYSANGFRYTFTGWSLRSGVEGENDTVGNTDLVYEAVYTATLDETQISVEKFWDDDDDFEGKRPESITIRLFANGEEVAAQVVTAEDGWTYTFENLPIYANDEVIVYTISEDAVEGYEMIALEGDAENGFKITNQYQIVVEDPKPPKTGDPIALVFALSVISMLGMAVIVLQRKKFN